jgi:non-specific serine/threonine protein kinase
MNHQKSFPRVSHDSEWENTDSPRQVSNLPLQLTSFIGRKQEIEALTRLLTATHLLTLTGVG